MILISLSLCRINKHAEQLSILRGIDIRGPTSVEKHLVALFRGLRWEGRWKNTAGSHTSGSNPKSITGSAAHAEICFPRTKMAGKRKRTDHLWTGTRLILTEAPAHVYMAVVCQCELMGGDMAPSPIRPPNPPAGSEQLTDSTSEQL